MPGAIGYGTRNVTFNACEDEAALLNEAGKAFGGRSELCRRAVLAFLKGENPAIATQIDAVRKRYGRHIASAGMLLAGLLSIGVSMLGHDPMVKTKAGTKACKTVVVKVAKAKGKRRGLGYCGVEIVDGEADI